MEYEYCAGLLVFRILNDKHQFLLVHPSNHTKQIYAIPKGHLNNEEEVLVAAIRETLEETGVKAKPIVQLPKIEYTLRSGNKKQVTIFLAEYISGVDEDGVALKHDWESDDVRFFDIDKLPTVFYTQRQIITDAIKWINGQKD